MYQIRNELEMYLTGETVPLKSFCLLFTNIMKTIQSQKPDPLEQENLAFNKANRTHTPKHFVARQEMPPKKGPQKPPCRKKPCLKTGRTVTKIRLKSNSFSSLKSRDDFFTHSNECLI